MTGAGTAALMRLLMLYLKVRKGESRASSSTVPGVTSTLVSAEEGVRKLSVVLGLFLADALGAGSAGGVLSLIHPAFFVLWIVY